MPYFEPLNLDLASMPQLSASYVFVYGTLRRGESRDINRLLPVPQWLGSASVSGLLYDLGTYPGLLLGGPGRVVGEVYAISPALERQLDAIEEVWPQQSGEYARREVLVQLDSHLVPHDEAAAGAKPTLLPCLLYEIAPERTQGRPLINSGDWVQYRMARAI
ncbi:Uncharacterized conserved protein YtfP, gamma-glutamylcyclotransferase (GGCT)/AIG2-like family [Polaromonas sp. OV174]|uniref:gamma-glutamylcyclotransferase family protein n=1 Tax=Polaromonas sp. OV174 TaxID=1855300 RepID=UPI0008EACA09|nr:gamma-glutamylcyclotransferase family protein [Polaromonas sp. OV174]SFC76787.1 Uncharacterized conserved protein YtfP, gamma-glutamylcyclotransferase (GGCT)/AIG2-like family [Polaromonas sp. OV174]